MTGNRGRAKRLMRHYMELIAKEAGIRWDSDNRSEIDELVDCLIDAAKEEMKEKEKSA